MSLKFNFQKFLSLILFFFICTSFALWGVFLKPKEVKAAEAVYVTNWYKWITHHAKHWANEWAMWVAEWAKNLAIDSLKRHLMKMMVDEIVIWIQGGGRPHFVSDLKGYLWDEINAAVGEMIWNSDLRWLCYPFSFKVRILLPFFSYRSHYPSCTLEDVIRNIEDFFDDFRNGSWIAWEKVYLDPQNSYWGALVMAHDTYLEEFAQEHEKRVVETIAGDQFLGEKKYVTDETQCHQGCYHSYYQDCVDECYEKILNMEECEEKCKEEAQQVCCKTKEIIITPGKAFSHALLSAQDATFKEIANLQSFTDMIPIVVDALITRLLREAGGLLNLSSSAPSEGWTPGNISSPIPEDDYKEKMSDVLNQRTYFDRKYAQEIVWYDKESVEIIEEEILPKLDFIKKNCPQKMPNVEKEISDYQKLSQDLKNEINSIEAKLSSYEQIQQQIENASTYQQVEELVQEGVSLFTQDGIEPIYTQEEVDQAREKYEELEREEDSISKSYQECSEKFQKIPGEF